MFKIIPLFIAFLLGSGIIYVAISGLFTYHKKTKKYLVEKLGYFFVLIGALGFFCTGFSALGGMNWLPKSFPWPVKYTWNATKANTDIYVVPIPPSGRIQLYDNNLKFIRGWPVEAFGGSFKINVSKENNINVYTSRGQRHYIFNLNGDLISQKIYTPKAYDSFYGGMVNLSLPVSPFLLVFTHPFYSWIIVVLGLIILIIADKYKIRKNNAKV